MRTRLILLLICVILLGNVVWASGVTFWETTKQTDIERGDAQGISISDHGMIKTAPALGEIFNTEQPVILSSINDVNGNIYLGTGHSGKVYKVDKQGKGSLWLETKELDITALAIDTNANLYVGSSPEGKVYKISPDGKSEVFFDPGDKYIWSLALDDKGTLFVGTGDKGIIYKVDKTGKGTIWAKTNEKHIITELIDRQGNLLVGTDPSGLVLKINPEGKTFALFDSPAREIHKLVLDTDGTIFALGITGKPDSNKDVSTTSTAPVISTDNASVTVTATFDDDATVVSSGSGSSSSATTARSTDTTGSKAVLYRLTPDGGNDLLWTSKESVALGLALGKNNEVLVGTNSKGRIYAIDPKTKDVTLLLQSTEEQTGTLLSTPNGLYATANSKGKLLRISDERVKEGIYTSVVHDTKLTASWGRLSWRASGNVQLQTRTGNTETPDATWSDWSTSYKTSEGEQVTSPAARFIQWRAHLQTGALLSNIKLAYLPRNVAPEVTQLNILAPGIALQEIPQQPIDPGILSAGLDPSTFGFPTNIQPRKVFQKGARSLQWQAEDRNGDSLIYSIYYRAVNSSDTEWHLLASELKNNYYTIDADALSDSKYTFKVVASDSNANPNGRALKGELVSEIIDIDNTPPEIKVGNPEIAGHNVAVKFFVTDNASLLHRAEYSIDGGNWQVVFPDDAITDSRLENYTLKAELSAGTHIIAFRCYDESANAGSNKATVLVK